MAVQSEVESGRILAGFLISHLTEDQESRLFDLLRGSLVASGRFLVLDSAWSEERRKYNRKTERQPRALSDGTAFEIYKRYISSDDIDRWRREHGLELRVEQFGAAFCAVSGSFI